jgi:hypothetical protein
MRCISAAPFPSWWELHVEEVQFCSALTFLVRTSCWRGAILQRPYLPRENFMLKRCKSAVPLPSWWELHVEEVQFWSTLTLLVRTSCSGGTILQRPYLPGENFMLRRCNSGAPLPSWWELQRQTVPGNLGSIWLQWISPELTRTVTRPKLFLRTQLSLKFGSSGNLYSLIQKFPRYFLLIPWL